MTGAAFRPRSKLMMKGFISAGVMVAFGASSSDSG
jgi:hypothetical protein